jgi:hypothetical protein
MDQIMNNAYELTTQLFGSDSEIPWWAWLLVVAAIVWKMVIPERQTAGDRDAALVAAVAGDGDTKRKKKKKK